MAQLCSSTPEIWENKKQASGIFLDLQKASATETHLKNCYPINKGHPHHRIGSLPGNLHDPLHRKWDPHIDIAEHTGSDKTYDTPTTNYQTRASKM